MPINAQYNTAAPSSLAMRIASYQRHKMFRAFLALGITAKAYAYASGEINIL